MNPQDANIHWHEIEQPAGDPLVPPVDRDAVEAHRAAAYHSYEDFLRNKLAELDRARPQQWHRDYSSIENYQRSIEPMRKRLQQMLGFWVDPPQRALLNIGKHEPLMENVDFTAARFTLEILPNLWTYAVELTPRKPNGAGLLVQHGYAGTPELACGFAQKSNAEDYSYRSMGIRAARRGFHVLAVYHSSGYGKNDDEVPGIPGYPHQPVQYGKNRIHRLALLAGGTMFGLDMMACSRGVDYLCQVPTVDRNRMGIYGLSQGGETAIYLPALDPRLRASVASAFFNHRFHKLVGPTRAMSFLDSNEEDKFFRDTISTFSDADIVSLIAPRAFAVEAGLHDGSVDFEMAVEEFTRAKIHHEKLNLAARVELIAHDRGHISATKRAMEFLTGQLG